MQIPKYHKIAFHYQDWFMGKDIGVWTDILPSPGDHLSFQLRFSVPGGLESLAKACSILSGWCARAASPQ